MTSKAFQDAVRRAAIFRRQELACDVDDMASQLADVIMNDNPADVIAEKLRNIRDMDDMRIELITLYGEYGNVAWKLGDEVANRFGPNWTVWCEATDIEDGITVYARFDFDPLRDVEM